ncbi:fimbria/pilus outer membrane usher protein [Aeromonas sp. R9-2]|uniref:fimbria/pilus outer membrane usher protein n=1 Tax=Aeromonas sp. R9-2 TaxID=3138479 RepID=UPI0034A39157
MKSTSSPSVIIAFIFYQFFWIKTVVADPYKFDLGMLKGIGDVDLSMLNTVDGLPGRYFVDVYLNGNYIESVDINFYRDENRSGLLPCLSVEKLKSYGVKVGDSPARQVALPEDEVTIRNGCANIDAIPDAKFSFKKEEQVLNIRVPQALLESKQSNDKSKNPALWDEGISGFLMNYRAMMSRYSGSQYNDTNYYLYLKPGFNAGNWRVRSSLDVTRGNRGDTKWNYASTYAERGLNDIRSRLQLGETYSRSSIFDSVPLLGGVISTDENMLPARMRIKSPSVRGVALVDSTIEIRQGSYLIHSEAVPAGPYDIFDIPGSYSAGDLEVTVRGSDGSRIIYTVPYSKPAIVLPMGSYVYSVAAGLYRPSRSDVERTPFGEFTLAYGTPWDITLLGGTQYSEKYQAASLGGGVGLGFLGDISVDAVVARAEKKNDSQIISHKKRLRYNKVFPKTGSSISLDSTLYNKQEFFSLSEVMDTYRDQESWSWGGGSIGRSRQSKKWSSYVSISQSLNEYGSVRLSALREGFYGGREDNNRYSLAHSTRIKKASLTFNYDRAKVYYQNAKGKWDDTFGVSLSIPINLFNKEPAYLSYRYQNKDQNGSTQDVGLRSAILDKQLAFGVNLHNNLDTRRCDDCVASLDATWYGKHAELGGRYSYSDDYEGMNASFAGGMLWHQDGVTFGQPLQNTVGLVSVDGTDSVSILNSRSVSTDGNGMALLSNLSSYQVNDVSIDPLTIPDNAFLTETNKRVIPTSGAIIPIKFPVRKGGNALIKIRKSDMNSPPFGAVVTDNNNTTGFVDTDGRVFMYGLDQAGTLKVKWSEGGHCSFEYDLDNSIKNKAGMYEFEEKCI